VSGSGGRMWMGSAFQGSDVFYVEGMRTPQQGGGQLISARGRGQNLDFRVDVINE